jgi:hypothetical protein
MNIHCHDGIGIGSTNYLGNMDMASLKYGVGFVCGEQELEITPNPF